MDGSHTLVFPVSPQTGDVRTALALHNLEAAALAVQRRRPRATPWTLRWQPTMGARVRRRVVS